jgi:hypothetical protein
MDRNMPIKSSEMVGLELAQEERKLLLTGLVFLNRCVEAALRSTPPGEELMLTARKELHDERQRDLLRPTVVALCVPRPRPRRSDR